MMAQPMESQGSKVKGFDSSQLLPPMHTSRRGLQQVLDLFHNATPNLKQLLLCEADIIYECRVCKGLFRGLVNFIEHKKSYCTIRAGIDNHVVTKALSFNMRDLYPNEDAAAPQVEPQPPTGSPVNDQSVPKRQSSEWTEVNDQSSEVGNAEAFVVLRPIPSTTEAIEQQVVRSDHIINREEIDKFSVFTPQPEGEDTSKIVGEIAIRQAKKGARTKKVEKREALHTILKNVSGKAVNGKDIEISTEITNEATTVSPPSKGPEVDGTAESPNKASGVSAGQTATSPTLHERKADSMTQGAASCQPTECQICKKKCKNWTALAWHMRIHKRPIFKCSLCRYSSASVYNLRRHMQTMHHLPTRRVDELLSRKVEQQRIPQEGCDKEDTKEGEGSSVPTCDVCFKTFANRRNVLRHKEIHQRERHSSDLSRGVTTSPSREEIAKSKVMQIMDEKNLKCRRCLKQLSTMRRLQQHCCNHFGFNRYRCKLCPYENNDYTQMRRHMMGKHGRQFRTIQQISEAIRSMKIGIWINLVQNINGNNNEEGVTSNYGGLKENSEAKITTVKEKTDSEVCVNKKENGVMKELNGDNNEVEDQEDDEEEEEDQEEEEEEEDDDDEDEGEEEEEDKKEEKNENDKSVALKVEKENKAVYKTPTKQQQMEGGCGRDPMVTPPGNNGPRKSPDLTPSRDMPIRQARLNHQSVSPRNQAEKMHGDKPNPDKAQLIKTNLYKTHSEKSNGVKVEIDEEDKAVLELMMDKKHVRCLNCNKRYQYLSSLHRHVRIHLLRGEADEHPSPTKDVPDALRKARAIESLINSSLLKCLKCRKRFESMSSLKRHVARHLGYSTFKCKYCGYLSRNYTWFKQHLIGKHPSQVRNPSHMGALIGSMKTKK